MPSPFGPTWFDIRTTAEPWSFFNRRTGWALSELMKRKLRRTDLEHGHGLGQLG